MAIAFQLMSSYYNKQQCKNNKIKHTTFNLEKIDYLLMILNVSLEVMWCGMTFSTPAVNNNNNNNDNFESCLHMLTRLIK